MYVSTQRLGHLADEPVAFMRFLTRRGGVRAACCSKGRTGEEATPLEGETSREAEAIPGRDSARRLVRESLEQAFYLSHTGKRGIKTLQMVPGVNCRSSRTEDGQCRARSSSMPFASGGQNLTASARQAIPAAPLRRLPQMMWSEGIL